MHLEVINTQKHLGVLIITGKVCQYPNRNEQKYRNFREYTLDHAATAWIQIEMPYLILYGTFQPLYFILIME
jgi:hypothetical protein